MMICNEDKPTFQGLVGSEFFHEMLQHEGVEILFGYPGAAILPVLEELYESPIQFVLTRHEQGVCHMADGMDAMLKTEGPCVLHVRVEPEENVWPMVAAGKALDEMELGRLA